MLPSGYGAPQNSGFKSQIFGTEIHVAVTTKYQAHCCFCFFSLSPPQVVQDWKFVAQVLDRIFLWLFLVASVTGSVLIFTPALQMWLNNTL